MARKQTDIIQLKLRLEEGLRRRLAHEAKQHEKSMNAEIIHRLESSFQKEDIKDVVYKSVVRALKNRRLHP